ncbi:MAG: 30S ribosomal protein S7 [Candidatus Shikimatogenerans bostrichidophilus]|nr:MAG: 30S ribosomal protein S7 [Candidatus Shikimatogenerans bostrichidophilus]
MRKIKLKKTKKYNIEYKYKDKIITYFINILMKNGKKNLAYKIIYKTLKIIEKKKIKKNNIEVLPIDILKESLNNISPQVIIKNKKIGGSKYNIPIKINDKKKLFLSIKWLIFFSKKRKEKNIYNKIANEIILSYNGLGECIKKKNEIHKIAESNKSYSHFKV